MGLTIEDKVENFPQIRYLNLIESEDRRRYMEAQAGKYGLNVVRFPIENFYKNPIPYDSWRDFTLDPTKTNCDNNEHNFQLAVIISQLRSMQRWYDDTYSPYAIFCDDDMSFESIESWNFTWNEFMELLPQDWKAVQLIRMRQDLRLFENWQENINPNSRAFKLIRRGLGEHNCGGGLFLMKREFVKYLLDRFIVDGKFVFRCLGDGITPGMDASEDTILCSPNGVYNFPMFYEDCTFESTITQTYPYLDMSPARCQFYLNIHNTSQDFYRCFWKKFGPTCNLSAMMRLDPI